MKNYRHRSTRRTPRRSLEPAPLGTANFQLANFRWITQDNWDLSANATGVTFGPGKSLQICSPPPAVYRGRRGAQGEGLRLAGRWHLFNDGAEAPVAWAEAQSQTSSFHKVTVLAGRHQDQKTSAPHPDALPFLISALLLDWQPDVLQVFFLDESLAEQSVAGCHVTKAVTPILFDRFLTEDVEPTVTLDRYEVSQVQWWEIFGHHRDALRYLTKRKARQTALHTPTRRRRPRHVFAMIFARLFGRRH